MRVEGWVTMATGWDAMNTARFVEWVRRRLVRCAPPPNAPGASCIRITVTAGSPMPAINSSDLWG